jgi:hypothetical protein
MDLLCFTICLLCTTKHDMFYDMFVHIILVRYVSGLRRVKGTVPGSGHTRETNQSLDPRSIPTKPITNHQSLARVSMIRVGV